LKLVLELLIFVRAIVASLGGGILVFFINNVERFTFVYIRPICSFIVDVTFTFFCFFILSKNKICIFKLKFLKGDEVDAKKKYQ
jgi:hypothetical protein